MKTFVIGDIHGSYKSLLQCLEQSGFDYQEDRLIALGDVCDRHSQVNLCIEELLKIEHCDYILGNHDAWVLDWALKGEKPETWLSQGGQATVLSYNDQPMPASHVDFLNKGRFYLEVGKKVFVHGGFDPKKPLSKQEQASFMWNRALIYEAYEKSLTDSRCQIGTYEEIFVGHTPVQNFKSHLPLHLCNLWAMDTGAGWSGSLTIMDIDTKQYWQSEPSSKLYGEMSHRS